MHRFFIHLTAIQGELVVLDKAQAHQIHSVLRLQPGARVAAFDGSGVEYTVELTDVSRGEARGRILETKQESREPATELTLYQGLLKADKFEWVLQKGTEIGIGGFVPMLTSRTISDQVSRSKRARWERIVVEAAEQSGRTRVPELAEERPFAEAVRAASASGGCGLIPWEEERGKDLKTALSPAGPVHLFIGPEGGLARDEIELAQAEGIQPVTLGPRILRAETAGLVAASAILYARDDLAARRAD